MYLFDNQTFTPQSRQTLQLPELIISKHAITGGFHDTLADAILFFLCNGDNLTLGKSSFKRTRVTKHSKSITRTRNHQTRAAPYSHTSGA